LPALGDPQRAHAFGELLLGLLALFDVERGADIAGPGAIGLEARHAGVEDPAVLAVVAAQPVVERVGLPRLEARRENPAAALGVLGVHELEPAVAAQLVLRAPGVRLPGRVEPLEPPIRIGHPDQPRRAGRRDQRATACFGVGGRGRHRPITRSRRPGNRWTPTPARPPCAGVRRAPASAAGGTW